MTLAPLVRAILACAILASAAVRSQQNILIVVADDVGTDSVGIYKVAVDPPPTPHLDALAARGLLFRNAWACPSCSPTRSSIMTGRYPTRTGIGKSISALDDAGPQIVLNLAETTLPEHLDQQQSGYRHGYFGKWHLGNGLNGGPRGPNMAGWSHFAGVIAGGTKSYYQWPRTVNGATASSTNYITSQIVDDALAWIQSTPEPWVCMVSFTAAHGPLHAPPPALHGQQLQGLTPQTSPRAFFKAMVEAMDTEIGRLQGQIDPGVMARTNVVFLSDNGTDSRFTQPAVPKGRAKGSPYQTGVHIPLLIAGPAVVAPGREVPALVGAIDVFSTVADLCLVQPQPQWVRTDSVSMIPHIASPNAPGRATLFIEGFQAGRTNTSGFVALRDDRHKLIRFLSPQGFTDELYDLVADPSETINLLAGTPTPAQQNAHAKLSNVFVGLRSTRGFFVTYGTRTCVGSNGPPAISATGSPNVVASYTVHLTNGPTSQPAFLIVGASPTRWLGLDLPLSLAFLGAGPGCQLHASGEYMLPTMTDATGNAQITLHVPPLYTLVAVPLYHTWLAFDAGAPSNPVGLTASDALAAVIGLPGT